MSCADGLKDSEIANEISNSSNDEDTSESESLKEKNTSRRKKALSRKKDSVNRRPPAENASKTGRCKTRKTKETQQDEGEKEEKRIKHLLKKTNKQHQQSKTISCNFESKEINTEHSKSDDRKIDVRKKDSLGKTLSDTNSSDNENTLKDCNRKDNIISKIFNSKIKKSKTRRSNQEHYLETVVRKNSSLIVKNIFGGYSEKTNNNLNGLKINPTCENNQRKVLTHSERSPKKEYLHDGSRSADNSHLMTDTPEKQSRIVQSNYMWKKVCVSDKVRTYTNQYSPSNPRKNNQPSSEISSGEKKCSVSKNLHHSRLLTSSSSSDSENDHTQKPAMKTNSNTNSSRRLNKHKVSKNSNRSTNNLTKEKNQAKVDTYVERSPEKEFLHDPSRSSQNSHLVKDIFEKQSRIVQSNCMWKKVSDMRKSFNQSFKSTEEGNKVEHFNLGGISTTAEERVRLNGNEVVCSKFNSVPNKLLIYPAVSSSSKTSYNCNSRHLNKLEISKKQSRTCFLVSSSSSSSDSENDPTQTPSMETNMNINSSKYLNKHEVSIKQPHTRFLTSSSSDSENVPTQTPSMETNMNINSSKHLNKHEVSKKQSHTCFLASSSSSDSENDPKQKPSTNTNCNDDNRIVTKSNQKIKVNCYEALSDLSNDKLVEKMSPDSDISSTKYTSPLSNSLGGNDESSKTKRMSRDLSQIFPRNSSLINNCNRRDVEICQSNVAITSKHTYFAYSSLDDESSESQEGRNMLSSSDSSDNVVEIERDHFIQKSFMNIVNDNPNKEIVENKNLNTNSNNHELLKCLPPVDLGNISQFSNNITKTELLLSDSKNVSYVFGKTNLSSRSSGNTNVSANNRNVTDPDVYKTLQTYSHNSSSNKDNVSSTEIKNPGYLYSCQDSSDGEIEFRKKYEASSSFSNTLNSTDTKMHSSTSNCLPGKSTRKRKAQNDESEATPSKISCDTLRSTPDTGRRNFFSSKKMVGNEDNSLPDDLYNPSSIHSPKKNSAKKNLFSSEKKMCEISLHITDSRTPTKQKKDLQNDKENRAQSLSKCKNESTPQKVTSKGCLSFEKDAETEGQIKYKLTPLKPAQTPTKQTNAGSSIQCERGSGTPRKTKGDNVHKEESQTLNELSPRKNNFDEVSPSKKVTESASKLKSNVELDEVDSRTRTPQKERKSSATERELKRLNIDCNPSLFKRRSTFLKSTTPQKHKDSDGSTVKTPQKGSTKKDVEKINEGRQVKRFTPCKNETKLSSGNKQTPLSPAGKCEKYKQNVMSPLQRKSVTVTTPVSKKKSGREFLPASMAKKEHIYKGKADDDLDTTRKQLHISTVPTSLPCRDVEFDQIKSFLLRKIEHSAGGCMYISGVPGTGKTATVHAVIRSLQQEADNGDLPVFDFVEVNGLRLTEPKQAYVRILQTLTDRKLSPDQAQQLLNKRFSANCNKSTIILVDELDYLCNRRQDVVYNILDWPTKRGSGLVVLTISNTMDLPERTLKGRVTSRMGLTRVTFQPYSHHQLRAIVEDRLCGTDTFHPDAVQLVARKVAAVSGDARRALDICRRTTELVTHGEQVTVSHVERALIQIFSGPRVIVIQSLCREAQLVLRAIRDINQRTGVDEAIATQVYQHLLEICLVEGCPRPTVGAMLQTCVALVALGLIVAEKGRVDIMRKMSLNVSSDDIHYALDNVKV